MGVEERDERRQLLRCGMVFVDAGLQSFALAISPFLLASNASGDDPSPERVLSWLGLLVAVFYLGRGATMCVLPEIPRHPTVPSFVLVIALAFVVILFYGWVETTSSLVIVRLFHGVLAGIASSMTASSMPTTAGHMFWFTGFALGPIITGVFYADSDNVISPKIEPSETQPALYSCLIFGLAVLLTGFFMLFFVKDGGSESDNCYEPLTGGSPQTSVDKPAVNMTGRLTGLGAAGPASAAGSTSASASGAYSPGRGTPMRVNAALNATDDDFETKDDFHDVKSELSSEPAFGSNPGAQPRPPRDTDVPERFVRGCNGNMDEARQRWNATLAWRAENNVDNILNEPQPDFKIIKQCYPHFFHGVSKAGHPVYYEQLGKIDIARLRENGVTVERLLRYYVFLTEYLWNEVEPDPNGQLVTILDLEGVGLKDLGGEALDFMKQASKIVQEHYVERCHKMFLVNVPYVFSFIWKMVQPLINENTRRKITILSSDYTQIQNTIASDQLPARYGGTSPPLGEAPQERAFRNFVEALNSGGHSPGQTPTNWPGQPGWQPKEGHHRLLSVRSELSEPESKASEFDGSVSTDYRQFAQDRGRFADWASKDEEEGDEDYRSELRSPAPEPDSDAEEEPGFFSRALFAGLASVQSAVSGLGETVLAASRRVGDRVKEVFDNGISFQQAHLGIENRYVYDEEKRMWVLQDPNSEEVYDETEKRLVRAILAAQGNDLEDSKSELEEDTTEIVLQSSILENHERDSADGPPSPTAMEQDKRGRLMLSALYILWRMMLVCTIESAAAVMYVPEEDGGLAFTATEIALVYAMASLVLMLCQVGRSSCAVRKARYPLQVLRWAAAWQLPAFALLIGVTYTDGDSNGVTLFRILILIAGVAVLLGSLLAASVGTIAIGAVTQWSRLAGVVMTMEAVGACAGPLLMARSMKTNEEDAEDATSVPYFLCFGLTILSLFLSCTVPAYWNKTVMTKGGFRVQLNA